MHCHGCIFFSLIGWILDDGAARVLAGTSWKKIAKDLAGTSYVAGDSDE